MSYGYTDMGDDTNDTAEPQLTKRRRWPRLPGGPAVRTMWVVQLIRDRIELFGHSPKITKLTQEHFGCCRHTAEFAVKAAYQQIKAELAEFRPNVSDFLIEVHLKTIALGFREDGRLVTPAATALAKLVGADAADKVHVTGEGSTRITIDEQNLVRALKLTNAQRLAEIDRVKAELAADEQTPEPAEFVPQPESPTEDELPEQEPVPEDADLYVAPDSGYLDEDEGEDDDE